MRPRPVALGTVIALTGACGGAGNDAATVDTAASAAPAEEQPAIAATGDSSMDTATGPVRDPRSSGAESPSRSVPAPVLTAPIAGADTAAGVVSVIGTAIDSRVVVQTTAGPIGVAGKMADIIRRLQGMEIWIQGPLSIAMGRMIPPRQITVERFEVRGVGGVPAADGTLREEAGELLIVSANGERTRLTSPPPALRELVGRRIWVTRAADGGVASFGAID